MTNPADVRLIEEYAAAQADRLTIPERAWGQCVATSTQLSWHLNQRGVATAALLRATGAHYVGREHWALILDSDDTGDPADFTVVDLTARQFDAAAGYPWIGPLTDWYDDASDWLNDHLDIEVYAPSESYAITAGPMWTDAYARDDHEPGEPMAAGLVLA